MSTQLLNRRVKTLKFQKIRRQRERIVSESGSKNENCLSAAPNKRSVVEGKIRSDDLLVLKRAKIRQNGNDLK